MTPDPSLVSMDAPKASSPGNRDLLCRRLDQYLAAPMAWLSLVFLVIAAGAIHRLGHGHISFFETEVILWALAALWPIFIAEGALRLFIRHTSSGLASRIGFFLLICLAPPVRLGGRSYSDPNLIWLPSQGWLTVDRKLRQQLEKFFSIPMILVALMVLPLLALEFLWAEEVRSSFGLALFLDIGTSLIWTVFAVEFIIMVAVARSRVTYCFRNWTDLAVVVLPMLDYLPFLRVMRLSRLLQLRQLTHLNRVYRFRALIMKAWRGILLLEVIKRVLGGSPEARLRRLKELREAKEEELQDLQEEIRDLERVVEQRCLEALTRKEGERPPTAS